MCVMADVIIAHLCGRGVELGPFTFKGLAAGVILSDDPTINEVIKKERLGRDEDLECFIILPVGTCPSAPVP